MLKGKTAAAITLGCKVNQCETDAMLDILRDCGVEIVEFEDVADIYLVNTCSVTSIADKKSRQMLHRAKKRNPNAIVIAAGCYVQSAEELLEQDEAVDIIISNNRKGNIARAVEAYIAAPMDKKPADTKAPEPKTPDTEMKRIVAQEAKMPNTESTAAYEDGTENARPTDSDGSDITKIKDNVSSAELHGETVNTDRQRASKDFVDINKETEYEELGVHTPTAHTRAYVKIQDGCNQFCSYCIIPYVRGRIRSRSEAAVIAEVQGLADSGIKEVVLTGIHISSYGKDKKNEGALIELIDSISKIKGIKRIRLGSLEPGIITEEFVRRISANPKVCPHFHLSLQSGCDAVLARMNRKYTCEEYLEKCDLLRRYYDRPALTTDVIVGFPGETDEEFEETVRYLKELNLYEMHIFKYSPRKGTRAAAMPGQVHPDVKNSRSDVLLELAQKNKSEYEAKYEDCDIEVLVEEVVKKDGGTYLRGHTERYMDILINVGDIPMPEAFVNSFVYARYTGEGDIFMV